MSNGASKFLHNSIAMLFINVCGLTVTCTIFLEMHNMIIKMLLNDCTLVRGAGEINRVFPKEIIGNFNQCDFGIAIFVSVMIETLSSLYIRTFYVKVNHTLLLDTVILK